MTTLCDEFDLILGNGFMVSHRAVLDYSNFTASLHNHGRLCTLTPRSILTDKGKPHVRGAEPSFRKSSHSLCLLIAGCGETFWQWPLVVGWLSGSTLSESCALSFVWIAIATPTARLCIYLLSCHVCLACSLCALRNL